MNVSIPRRPDCSSAFWKDSFLHCGRQWTPRTRSHEHTSASFRKKLRFEMSDSNDTQRFEALESNVTEIQGKMSKLMHHAHQLAHLPLYSVTFDSNTSNLWGSLESLISNRSSFRKDALVCSWLRVRGVHCLPQCSKESFQKADEPSGLLGMETFKACSRSTAAATRANLFCLRGMKLLESRP